MFIIYIFKTFYVGHETGLGLIVLIYREELLSKTYLSVLNVWNFHTLQICFGNFLCLLYKLYNLNYIGTFIMKFPI